MQVVGGKNRPEALLEPGIDFITERSIDQSSGERVIDTGWTFLPAAYTRLNGRKYLGENTVKELAGLIGWVDGESARKIKEEYDSYRASVEAELAKVKDALAAVAFAADTIAQQPVTLIPDVPDDAEAGADKADAKAAVEVETIAAAEQATADAAATAAEGPVTVTLDGQEVDVMTGAPVVTTP
jgi:hypothetical protein